MDAKSSNLHEKFLNFSRHFHLSTIKQILPLFCNLREKKFLQFSVLLISVMVFIFLKQAIQSETTLILLPRILEVGTHVFVYRHEQKYANKIILNTATHWLLS